MANIVLGIWVALSPFVSGFSQDVANIAVGIALVLAALATG